MAPNERAQKNHEELFPGYISTAAVTDPELIAIFDYFAFDEVLSHGNLDIRTRLMVQLAAIIACQPDEFASAAMQLSSTLSLRESIEGPAPERICVERFK
jgi:alkylhydroperoxidase/carboxymuconolactone decarboxylase family protein YurZ